MSRKLRPYQNGTQELVLPKDDDSLLVTLNLNKKEKISLDGRVSPPDFEDQIWALYGVHPLKAADLPERNRIVNNC